MNDESRVKPASGPLTGLKVIDMSSFIAGCYTGLLMGDMGADVIKVESLNGDGARHWGPFLAGESKSFQGWNRSKRSLSVDLRTDDGREIVHALLRETDIVVENFRPGVTKRLAVDYETVRELNPKVIYCSITGFGEKGPHGGRPAYDPVLQSMSGAARANERYSGKAGICSVAISDYGAGLLGSTGILAALYHRERTGEGQLIETTLLQAAMAMQNHNYCDALEVDEEPPFGIYPYKLFETKDDLIFIAGGTNKFWEILCEVLGEPGLAKDPKYKMNTDRVEHAEELTDRIQPIFHQKTTAEWEAMLVEKGVPCAAIKTWDEFFDHPQVAAMGMDPRVEHSKIGPMRVSGLPLNFAKTPGRIQRAAPTLGEQTDEILGELGYDATRIAALREEGCIK